MIKFGISGLEIGRNECSSTCTILAVDQCNQAESSTSCNRAETNTVGKEVLYPRISRDLELSTTPWNTLEDAGAWRFAFGLVLTPMVMTQSCYVQVDPSIFVDKNNP